MTDLAENPSIGGAATAAERAALEANDLGEYRSLRTDVWRQFRKHKGALAGVITLALVTFACFIGPFIVPFSVEIDTANANLPPSTSNFWGTDNLGRDAFTRALIGGRISLLVGFVAMAISIIVGVLVGVLAGYVRKLDFFLMLSLIHI